MLDFRKSTGEEVHLSSGFLETMTSGPLNYLRNEAMGMLAGIFWNMQNPDLGEQSSELKGGEIYISILTSFKTRYRYA